MGPIRVEEVGHAGEVGEDVVAVEAHQRRELADHLQQLGGDDQQQRVPAGSTAQTPNIATATIALK